MAVATSQINGMSNGGSMDLAALRKNLPHADLETGIRNRFVRRDPISGLGELPKEHCPFGRSKTPTLSRRAFNPVLISWDADTSLPINSGDKQRNGTAANTRNPIALTGDLGAEVDSMRTTARPRTGQPREPQRNPISGRGDFGCREWDPVWKYTGKARRAKSTTGLNSNPLTGHNMKSFTVTNEEKTRPIMSARIQNEQGRNILTGENCATFSISSELKEESEGGKKKRAANGRNTLTGAQCQTYDFNAESRSSRCRGATSARTNPLSGENVNSFAVSLEERPRTARPYVYTNTVTGENRPSYKISPIERNVSARVASASSNPLSGENVLTYTYRMGEKKNVIKKRDISSPITGEGSRGATYCVSVEERRGNASAASNGHSNGHSNGLSNGHSNGHTGQHQTTTNGQANNGLLSPRSGRNVLTGENCETYLVCQEMRSEKKHPATNTTPTVAPASTNGGNISSSLSLKNKNGFNIITGEAH